MLRQIKYRGHANYCALFEGQFFALLQTKRPEKDLLILGLMDCLTDKITQSTYNLYMEKQNKGDLLMYEQLWRALKKEGSRVPEDHYRDGLENFRMINNLFLEHIQIARPD